MLSMRALIQRVSQASVSIDGLQFSNIGIGLLVLLGIEADDDESDLKWLAQKIAQIRLFDDAEQIPNLSVKDINGEILLVSQFTLYALTKKGNRPSYIRAARPEHAEPLYNQMTIALQNELNKTIATGRFGANMQVSLINDGPITIWIDTKDKA
jgi:D-tyrosyl-tRNA(Tyr) deacylase